MKIYKVGDNIVVDAEGEKMCKPLQLQQGLNIIIKNFYIDVSKQETPAIITKDKDYPIAD